MMRRVEPMPRAAADSVSVLHRACFPEDAWDARAIEQIMAIPGFVGLIGWKEDVPVGFALALNLGKEFEIISLGVISDHRRAGVGSTLLDSICSAARRRGAECVVLEVALDNDAARALYAARGFSVVGRRRNYYRHGGSLVDALILRLMLAAASLAT